jgi:serine/threonine protein kinase
MSKGHGHEVDLWTLGVLIFEMLAGEVPFVAESTIALYGKILKGSFSLPSYFSPVAKQIIQGMRRTLLPIGQSFRRCSRLVSR